MTATVSVNGRLTLGDEAVVSVFDHGFVFGEGIYETLRTYDGRPFLFERHLGRLRRSAASLSLTLPLSDEGFQHEVHRTLEAANLGPSEAYIRILVTRGVGELSYDPSSTPSPTVVIIVKPLAVPTPEAYSEGVDVVIVSVMRNHPGTVDPAIKSNNLLNSVLAGHEALRRGAFEGLMRNHRGELAECTLSNLFIVSRQVVRTPPLSAGLLAGITRAFVLKLAVSLGMSTAEEPLHDQDLFGAEEAFLTSTTREIVPIVRVDDRLIGTGLPGPVTTQLLEAFRQRSHASS